MNTTWRDNIPRAYRATGEKAGDEILGWGEILGGDYLGMVYSFKDIVIRNK